MIKAGYVRGDKGHPYFFAWAVPYRATNATVDNFRKNYFLLLPGLISVPVCWAGHCGPRHPALNLWLQRAGRSPGSNLSLSIPRRNANDELDN